ncbi:nitrite reductase small subunit NirD [Marinicrinis sediminis]|uniref:Nitrite reductase small subunit NirD n=1 Tax=Marinicrinis sediminis TaxID=1652465 RepID=A0ABW5R5P6_9BACL
MIKVIVGKLEQLQERRAVIVRAEGEEIAVFKCSDGSLFAIENRCPHKHGKLSEGMVCGQVVYCPLHDWRIDLAHGQALAPDKGCVRTYPVEVDEGSGEVVVFIQPVTREAS